MRIYYHDFNDKIRENCWDESRWWFPGAEVAGAEAGSGLAALRWRGTFTSCQRVYYKAPHHDGIWEAQHDGSHGTWKTITLPVSDASPTTSPATVKHANKIWVFYQKKDGIVRDVVCDSGYWGQGALWQPAKKGTPLAAMAKFGTMLLYHLSDGNEIREHCFFTKEWYHGKLDASIWSRVQIHGSARYAGTWVQGGCTISL
ncbi:hypothetical protein DFP73DRAFT_587793 [Morchella snyderi]|nr:hypothetical protein DFP73DRAFT_587793 [Morchella snyderi]